MAVSDPRFAAQLVAPAEEPKFFDDLGCLAEYLRAAKSLPKRARAYVADRRTKAWIPAGRAVYAKVPGLDTPMASQLVAHADPASREADPLARPGSPLAPGEVFGAPLPSPVAKEGP